MTASTDQFLGREMDPEVSKLLGQFSDGIDRLPEFGAKIIKWDFERTSGGDHLLPAVLFLRNFLGLIDAISLLIRNSSVEPCNSLMRTSLETLFYLEYLLKEDQEKRALCFLVWNTHRNIKLYNKVDGGSELYKRLQAKYANDKFLKNVNPTVLKELVKPLLLNAEEMLKLPSYKPIEAEYQRTKAIKKNPDWFTLFDGPKNIEDLANKSDFSGLYEVLYRSWSNSVHGTDIIQGKLSQDESKRAEIVQIRYPKEAQSLTLYCFNLSVPIFKTFIESRIPSRINDFNKWYLNIKKFTEKLSEKELLYID